MSIKAWQMCEHTDTECTVQMIMYQSSLIAMSFAAYGVSVTAFQGLQRQILLDMLRCMGVGVQKQMHMGTATHVVAQDMDDQKSEKLAHARK